MRLSTKALSFIILLLMISALPLLFYFIKNGIALTHDSGAYVIGAYSLAHDNILLDQFGNPSVIYPPLYALLLAPAYKLSISVFLWAAIIQILAYSALSWVCYLFCELLFEKSYRIWCCLILLFSAPLLMNALFLWAELGAILFIYISLYFFYLYQQSLNTRWLLLAILFGLMATFQRIIGVTVLISEGIALVFLLDTNWRKHLAISSAFAALSLSPILVWAQRNKLLNGHVANSYDPAIFSFPENLYSIASIAGTYFLPSVIMPLLRVLLVAILVIMCFVLLFQKTLSQKKIVALLLIFCTVYILVFGLVNSIWFVCEFDDRYLSPLWIGLVLIALVCIFKISEKYNASKLAIVLLVLMTGYSSIRFCKNYYERYTQPSGYSVVFWENHKIVHWLKKNTLKRPVFTDSPMVLSLFVEPTYYLPPTRPSDALKHESFFLIRWNKEMRLDYAEIDIDGYQKIFTFAEVKSFHDCTIYKLTKK